MECSLVLIKPDAMKLSLTGYLFSQLSEFQVGLRFAGLKVVHVTRALAEEHYAEHKGKPFYPPLLDYITGLTHFPDEPENRRVIAVVYVGDNAVARIRELTGPTNPHVARETSPGTLRSLGTVTLVKDAEGNIIRDRIDNLVHASASVPEGEGETKLWFAPTEIAPQMQAWPTERCEAQYYMKDGKLLSEYEPGATCLLAPGMLAWKSDLETLRGIAKGETPESALGRVAVKYSLNIDGPE